MKTVTEILIVIFVFALTSCQFRKKTPENKPQSEIVKKYDATGILAATITMKDGKRNGITTTFYKDGKVSVESNYVNNIKSGIEKKYYENGAVYRTRQYLNGKMNGEEKRYYRDGILMTRQTYKDNMPANDLQEYHRSGNLITKYPKLVFKTIRNRDYHKQKIVQFYFEDRSNPVQFYEGKLLEGKYFDDLASPLPIKNGIGEVVVYTTFSGKVTISAKMITRNRAPYIVQKDFYITADN
jgi:hypothetical protein